jgi:hypothetical protein
MNEIETIKQNAIATLDDNLLEKLAWEVAKNVIDHHKWVYSEIFNNAPSTLQISLRNGIFNQIKYAMSCRTEQDIKDWIAKSEKQRKQMRTIKRKTK